MSALRRCAAAATWRGKRRVQRKAMPSLLSPVDFVQKVGLARSGARKRASNCEQLLGRVPSCLAAALELLGNATARGQLLGRASSAA